MDSFLKAQFGAYFESASVVSICKDFAWLT